MAVEKIPYEVNGRRFVGALVYDDTVTAKRPLLLVAPNWLGVTDEAIRRGAMLAGRGFIGFVADMYGDGRTSGGPPEAAQWADALRDDPAERRARIAGALEALTREAAQRGIGDPQRRAAAGFCFGGGNVLELARAGADIAAAVSLHGDLTTAAPPAEPGEIKAALLVIHGAADPVSDKDQRDAFEAEMEAAGVPWQMLTFGGLLHSFCEEDADVPGIAKYDAAAARQSVRLLEQFIADAFAGAL